MSKPDHCRVCLIQMHIVHDKTKNVDHAFECVRKCVKEQNPRLVILPEIFNCPYDINLFVDSAETIPDGYTCQRMSALAKECGIYLVAGSIVEKDQNKYYNTATVWSPMGEMIGKHRKLHLYDIFVKESPFKETDVFTPGDKFTVVEMDNRKVGIAICNDYRFDELARVYRNMGCDMVIYPTEVHVAQSQYWDCLLKARAADNQMFVCAVSSARDMKATYTAYGHTMCIDPWAKVLCEASEKEECLVCDLDFTSLERCRKEVPLFKQRRTDMYDTVPKKM